MAIALRACVLAALTGAAVVSGSPDRLPAPLNVRAETPAEVRAERLDALFSRLKIIRDETEADAAVAEIWQLWMKSSRNDIDTLMQHAVTYIAVGHLEWALRTLDQVVERAPDYAEGWNKRATVLYVLGQHPRALADIEKVLTLEPRHFGALAGRGLIHAAAERWREAFDAYMQALVHNPFLKERHGLIPLLEKKAGLRPL
ncbi:MAG: tetratricopeptide repeat protein [Hyphomicrobiaceae bacterium]